MTNRVLESFSNTITINLSSSGIVSIDVNEITSSYVTDLAPSAIVDTTNATNITSGSFSGTSNNALYIGGLIAANVVSNAQLQANLLNLSSNNATFNSVVTIGNSSINSVMNSTFISIGNTSINATINSTMISFNSGGVVQLRALSSTLLTNRSLIANSVAAQNVFPSGQRTVTLVANTTYSFEATYLIANAGNGVNTQIQTSFANSANISSILYRVECVTSNGGGLVNNNVEVVYWITPDAYTVCSSANLTNLTIALRLTGFISTANTSSAITPQISYTVASNSTPIVYTGSYIKFNPLSNTSTATIGDWS
jgi:hypothetical protein